MKRSSTVVPIIAGLALLLSIVIAFSALINTVSAEEAATDTIKEPTKDTTNISDPEPIPDDAKLLKMKVRELKAFLEKKGADAECKACTSKREYVDRIRETADWPNVLKEEPKKDDELPLDEIQKLFAKGQSSEEMEKLRKELEKAGIDASNFISTNGLSPEDLAERLKGMDMAKQKTATDTEHTDL